MLHSGVGARDGPPRLPLLEDGEERLHLLALDDVLVEGARDVLGEVVQDDNRILEFYSYSHVSDLSQGKQRLYWSSLKKIRFE